MEHVRLGVLARTRRWQQVVEELRLGADVAAVAAVAAAAAHAAEEILDGASKDPAFLHAFWLLTQIPPRGARSCICGRPSPSWP